MMNFSTLKKMVIGGTKGSFRSIVWERPMKTKKAFADQVIVKRSFGVVRFGIEYDNIRAVQEKRESGELPEVNMGLTWGEWMLYPYFIQHKGNVYLRCATSKGNKIRSEYFLNGKMVDKETIKNMCLASEFKNTDDLDVFTINTKNIIAVR